MSLIIKYATCTTQVKYALLVNVTIQKMIVDVVGVFICVVFWTDITSNDHVQKHGCTSDF